MRYKTRIAKSELREPEAIANRARFPLTAVDRRRCVDIAAERAREAWGAPGVTLVRFDEYTPNDAFAAAVTIEWGTP